MYFENTGIENTTADLKILDEIMLNHSLVREGQWDYERVTYDKKFDVKEGMFYLRIFGFTKEGDVGGRNSNITIINLMKPVIGKHYYPHGVEYGDEEVFPAYLVKSCKKTLDAVKADLNALENRK